MWVRLKLVVQVQGGGRILDVDGQGGWGSHENWPYFMDVICVSSLKALKEMILILNEV